MYKILLIITLFFIILIIKEFDMYNKRLTILEEKNKVLVEKYIKITSLYSNMYYYYVTGAPKQ